MNLKTAGLNQILSSYPFSHRFLVYFASQCAKTVIKDMKDPRSKLAVEVAERFGLGEEFTPEYLIKVRDDADAVYAAAYATDAAAAAAAAAAYATYAYAADAAAAAYAAHASGAAYAATAFATDAAYWASPTRNSDDFKPLLFDLIKTRLTPLEQVLIFGEEL